jgi:hypothetical protein
MRPLTFSVVAILSACSSSPDAVPVGNLPGAGGQQDTGTAGVPIDSGSNAAGGREGTGGSQGTSGSQGTGGSQGTAGGFPDGGARCTPNTALPANAPALTMGTWVNISPAGVPFDSGATAFAQGMALDPCNVGTLYLTVHSEHLDKATPGLYKTTDGGATWAKVGQLDAPVNVVIDPRNPQHLYASDGVRGKTQGFWVSNDGGNNWTIPDGFATAAKQLTCCDVYHVEADPTDFDHVLVSFHYGDGVLESFDGGTSWKVHKPDPRWAGYGGYDVLFLFNPGLGLGDNRRWLYGTQGKGYWLSTDAGTSWTKVTDVNMEHGGAQLYYSKSGVLYASGNPHVIRSTDNGATWTPLTSSSSSALSVIGDGTYLYSGNHGYDQSFSVAKESADQSWTAYNNQTFYEGPFEMAFDSANRILYSSNIRAGIWALKVKP